MSYCFIYGIIKALKNNLKLIFLDESGFQLGSNNLYMWRKDNELIYDGAENNNKKRVNLILVIDKMDINNIRALLHK